MTGHIVNVLIKESHTFSMIGELVEDPLIVLANDFARAFKKEEIVKRFEEAKKAWMEDASLLELVEKQKEAQKALALTVKEGRDEDYAKAKKAFAEAKERVDNHPVSINYRTAAEELVDELSLLQEKLK